jgi:hypothetical protein
MAGYDMAPMWQGVGAIDIGVDPALCSPRVRRSAPRSKAPTPCITSHLLSIFYLSFFPAPLPFASASAGHPRSARPPPAPSSYPGSGRARPPRPRPLCRRRAAGPPPPATAGSARRPTPPLVHRPHPRPRRPLPRLTRPSPRCHRPPPSGRCQSASPLPTTPSAS